LEESYKYLAASCKPKEFSVAVAVFRKETAQAKAIYDLAIYYLRLEESCKYLASSKEEYSVAVSVFRNKKVTRNNDVLTNQIKLIEAVRGPSKRPAEGSF